MKKPVNKYAAAYPVDSKASYYTNCETGNTAPTPTTCSVCNTGGNVPTNNNNGKDERESWW
jgi:hypothetical protein